MIFSVSSHWLAKARNYDPVIRLPIYKDHDGRHYYGHADLLPVQDLNNQRFDPVVVPGWPNMVTILATLLQTICADYILTGSQDFVVNILALLNPH